MVEKNKPKRDGSGMGRRLNMGRGGCDQPRSIGIGMSRRRHSFNEKLKNISEKVKKGWNQFWEGE